MQLKKARRTILAAVLCLGMTVGMLPTRVLAENSTGTAANAQIGQEAGTDSDTGVQPGSTIEKQEEKFDPDNVPEEWLIRDANGNLIDLGGMEIVIRDWWTGVDEEEDGEEESEVLTSSYKEDYIDWIQKTYNFTIVEQAISDWGSAIEDFIDYVYAGGDDNNYIFTLHDDVELAKALYDGIAYDFSKLDCLDAKEAKFQNNLVHQHYSMGREIYAVQAGHVEPRTGVFFNKKLLREAGIDPESLYDMQANDTWDWDAFTDILERVQCDKDGDGEIDVYGATSGAVLIEAAIASDGASLIGQDENCRYVCNLDKPETVKAMEFANELYNTYWVMPGEDEDWEYYKKAFCDGRAAFLVEDAWPIDEEGGYLHDMDDLGFVMFPKGPDAEVYYNNWADNILVIPACYDDDRAWKIAFAWNLYTNVEDDDGVLDIYQRGFGEDTRAVNETIVRMRENGTVSFAGMVPGIDPGRDVSWKFGPGNEEPVELIVSGAKEVWEQAVIDANIALEKKLATQSFDDVKFGDWYVKAIQCMLDNGIMNGKGESKTTEGKESFDPKAPITRAEFVTVLYNKEAKPDAEFDEAFSDVKDGKWYAKAVSWSHASGVAKGYGSGEFGVSDDITREALAQMLYNYAKSKGYDVTLEEGEGDLSKFEDKDKIDEWAEEAIKWVTAKGIMNGSKPKNPGDPVKLSPLNSASRAECASMIQKFMQIIEAPKEGGEPEEGSEE